MSMSCCIKSEAVMVCSSTLRGNEGKERRRIILRCSNMNATHPALPRCSPFLQACLLLPLINFYLDHLFCVSFRHSWSRQRLVGCRALWTNEEWPGAAAVTERFYCHTHLLRRYGPKPTATPELHLLSPNDQGVFFHGESVWFCLKI